MLKQFVNTGILARFILRRDRIRISLWIISLVALTVLIAAMLPDLYSTGEERQIMAETMKNPAITVMLGPGYGLDDYTDGAMMAHFMLVFTALAVAIMNILLTTRYTREDEEEGRIEMIRSLPVGTLSTSAAAIIIMIMVNIVLALLTAFGLYSLGLESMDLMGSLLYGASLGATGIFFTAITGLFSQLTSNTRSALGYSFSFLIISYIVRGIGDVENEVLSLISPLGLILRTEVFVNNYWWPVFVTLGLSISIFILAFYLNSIRDLGSGFISAKPGRRRASIFLLSPLGLSLRLQRTTIISWTLGMLILGMSYGSILGDLEGFIDSSELIQQMIPDSGGYSLTERFVPMLMSILSILGTIPVLMYILKLRSEEKKNRSENLLTRAVSRNNILFSYTFVALATAPIIQLMSVLGLWSAATFVMDDPISLNTLIESGFAHLPAMWLMVGLAVFLIGFMPKFTGLTWLYLGYSFFVVYMGDMLQVPEWMAKITPFGHIPQIPMEDIEIEKMLILILIAITLIIAGFIGYNRRDIEG